MYQSGVRQAHPPGFGKLTPPYFDLIFSNMTKIVSFMRISTPVNFQKAAKQLKIEMRLKLSHLAFLLMANIYNKKSV